MTRDASIRAALCGLALILVGCGRETPAPSTETPPRVATTTTTSSTTTTTDAPPPAGRAEDADAGAAEATDEAFVDALAEVEALENAADFPGALLRARELRRTFRAPGQLRELDAAIRRLNEAKRVAHELPFAIQNLAAEDPVTVRIARRKLLRAGRAGRIFLRAALDSETPAIVAGAAATLAEDEDVASIPRLLALAETPERTVAGAGALRALHELQPLLGTNALRAVHALLAEDAGLARYELAGLLTDVYVTRCDGDGDALDALLDAEETVRGLRRYTGRMLAGGDEDLLRWACEHGSVFLPELPGLHATAYDGQAFLEDRESWWDARIERHDDPAITLSDGRSAPVYVAWTGWLDVPRDGDYRIHANGDDSLEVRVNGTSIATGRHWRESGGSIKLRAGRADFEARFINEGGASRVNVRWEGPDIGRTERLPYRATPWPGVLLSLQQAVTELASTNSPDAVAARDRLFRAGPTGRVLLREAVRRAEPATAAKAAGMLAELRDPALAGYAAARLSDATIETAAPLHDTLREALRATARAANPVDLAPLADLLDAQHAEVGRTALAGLCAVLDRRCRGDAKVFDALFDQPGLARAVRTRVRAALQSDDPEVVLWAAAFGQPVAAEAPGLRATYYDGDAAVAVREVFDTRLSIDENAYPMPDGRDHDLAARWEGHLHVPKDGRYVFRLRGEDRAELTLDGERIATSTHRHREDAQAVELKRGRYPIELTSRVDKGTGYLRLEWEGPDLGRRILAAPHLSAPAVPRMLRRVEAAIPALGSAEVQARRAARDIIAAADATAYALLRKAMRDGAEPVARAAADWLIFERDTGAVHYVLDWLRNETDAARHPAAVAVLGGLADRLEAEDAAALYADWLAAAPGMDARAAGLCAIAMRATGQDAAAFGKRVGADDAWGTLRGAVETALAGSDDDEARRAAKYGAPFAPLVPGLETRFYAGRDRDRLLEVRIEGDLRVDENAFPVPREEQENVAAVAEGYFRPPRPGTYRFRVWADDEAAFEVAGQTPARSTSWRESNGTVELDDRLHPMRLRFENRGGRARFQVQFEGAGTSRRSLRTSDTRSAPWDARLDALEAGTRDLTADGAEARADARRAFRAAGPVGDLYLQRALRHADGAAAVRAAAILARRAVPGTAARIVERLRAGLDGASAQALLDELLNVGEQLAAADAAWVHAGAGGLTGKDADALLAVRCALAAKRPGAADAFDAWVGAAGAYESLRADVRARIDGTDRDDFRWACLRGGPFAPRMPGILVAYHADATFGPVLKRERLSRIDRGNNGWHLPEDRRENFAARWSGFLQVEKGGTYKIRVKGDDAYLFRIAGETVIDNWTHVVGTEHEAQTKLTAGLHAVDVLYHQDTGNHYLYADWQGPGENGRIDDFVSPALPDELAELDKHLAAFGAERDQDVRSARDAFKRAGELGEAYVAFGLRTITDPRGLRNLAAYAADIKDPAAGALLDERMAAMEEGELREDLQAQRERLR